MPVIHEQASAERRLPSYRKIALGTLTRLHMIENTLQYLAIGTPEGNIDRDFRTPSGPPNSIVPI